MALVRTFEPGRIERRTLHDEVSAAVTAFTIDGRKIVQIDTFGRKLRQDPGMKSQTIQLDQEGAQALAAILKREFGLP